MRFINDDDDDLYDEDEYEDYDDDDEDDDDEDDDSDDADIYDTLEYVDTCQIMTRKEIIDDIKLYLRKYQPMYKIIRKKDM